MEEKYISVKVCGNPHSNSGFTPLLMCNNPNFNIEDRVYSGFDNCSFFFTIKFEERQVVYKLIKNQVYSYDGRRLGFLCIAFSIPSGYKLEGYTPYEVLCTLKDEFLENGMRCDGNSDKYRYATNNLSFYGNILNDVAKSYRLSPTPVQYQTMNPNGPIGYINQPREKMEELFKDVRYPMFANYKEILVAETGSPNDRDMSPINDIEIPRRVTYCLIDGLKRTYIDRLDKEITIKSEEDEKCFTNKEERFTINELLGGRKINGIDIDENREEINVNKHGWATPKTMQFSIKVEPADKTSAVKSLLKLTLVRGMGVALELSPELTFSLSGSAIRDFYNSNIQVSLVPNDTYRLERQVVIHEENTIKVVIGVRQPARREEHTHRGENVPAPSNRYKSNVLDVILNFPENKLKRSDDSSRWLRVKLHKTDTSRDHNYIGSCVGFQIVEFKKEGNDYVGHFYIPKTFNRAVYLVFDSGNLEYTKQISIDEGRNEKNLGINVFESQKRSFIDRHKKLFKWLCLPLIVLILGMIVGYAIHEPLNRLFHNEQNSESRESGNSDEKKMEEARRFLNDAGEKLHTKEVAFEKIGKIYERYKKDEQIYNKCDSMSNGGICSLIRDTKLMSDAIQSGKTDSIGSYLEKYDRNKFNLYVIHAGLCKQIVNDKPSKNRFKEKKSTLKSFADIEKIYQHPCDKCNLWFDSEKDLASHKQSHESPGTPSTNATLNQGGNQTRYTCETCGSDTWFYTQRELSDHKNTKHMKPNTHQQQENNKGER